MEAQFPFKSITLKLLKFFYDSVKLQVTQLGQEPYQDFLGCRKPMDETDTIESRQERCRGLSYWGECLSSCIENAVYT